MNLNTVFQAIPSYSKLFQAIPSYSKLKILYKLQVFIVKTKLFILNFEDKKHYLFALILKPNSIKQASRLYRDVP